MLQVSLEVSQVPCYDSNSICNINREREKKENILKLGRTANINKNKFPVTFILYRIRRKDIEVGRYTYKNDQTCTMQKYTKLKEFY